MSRGFWIIIGAIGGLFLGAFAGSGIAQARFGCCSGESGYPVIGMVLGVVIGSALAWNIAGRRISLK
jgi:hypothetical protein